MNCISDNSIVLMLNFSGMINIFLVIQENILVLRRNALMCCGVKCNDVNNLLSYHSEKSSDREGKRQNKTNLAEPINLGKPHTGVHYTIQIFLEA